MTSNARTIRIQITGMSCGHCVQAVTKALAAVPRLTVGKVSVGSAEATVESEETVKLAIEAIGDAGFDAKLAPSTNSTSA